MTDIQLIEILKKLSDAQLAEIKKVIQESVRNADEQAKLAVMSYEKLGEILLGMKMETYEIEDVEKRAVLLTMAHKQLVEKVKVLEDLLEKEKQTNLTLSRRLERTETERDSFIAGTPSDVKT